MLSIENRVRHVYNQGYEQGLKAGREQTMTREQALKLLADARYADDLQGNNDLQTAHIMAMEALEQEPKNGHWIAEKIYPPLSDAQITVYRCSCCDLHFGCVSNYCPNCGARMESEEQ
jgi:rubrerythrin